MDIFEVIREGNLEYLKKLVSEGANVEAKNNFGNTPLSIASGYGQFEIVKYLIEEHNANVEAKNSVGFGATPLIYASLNGHLEIVKYLIEECNANVEAKNNYGETPLLYASIYGRLEIVKYLIENGANYEELIERLEKRGDNEKREQLEKIILEVADSRVKFITSDKY